MHTAHPVAARPGGALSTLYTQRLPGVRCLQDRLRPKVLRPAPWEPECASGLCSPSVGPAVGRLSAETPLLGAVTCTPLSLSPCTWLSVFYSYKFAAVSLILALCDSLLLALRLTCFSCFLVITQPSLFSDMDP